MFNQEIPELYKSFKDLKKKVDPSSYQQDLMLAFWLALDLEMKEEANAIIGIDPLIPQIIENIENNARILD